MDHKQTTINSLTKGCIKYTLTEGYIIVAKGKALSPAFMEANK
jgi:hypothetical protein